MVSQKLLKDLQFIIKEDYGKELDIKDVSKIANGLVDFYNLVAEISWQEKSGVNRNKEIKT